MSDVPEVGDDRSTTDNIPNPIRVGGNGNQVIPENFGVAINSVGRDVVINQPQPKFLSLHQLPADIADFTGRKAEINTIRQQLLGGKSLVISAVAGMPGVGKSKLAIHVAQQLAESDFPDVQLYVDLRGADGDALEPGMVLARWLRAFGLDESMIPADLQERASVYRSRLSGKRAIILLDNAKDEAQVRPLLPGSQTCVAIVTSRRLLGALEGSTVLKLEVMLEGDARDLLATFVGMDRLEAEPEAAAEILRLCGGLPLAIRIVGGMLRSKGHWSLAEYSRKLADETQRLEHLQLSDLSVRASFELSYRELSADDGLLFGRLGILVGKDFGEELAGVVHESDSPVVEGLERLIDAQLLEVDADQRYHFHDLLRLFAFEKLKTSTSVKNQNVIKQEIVDWSYTNSKIMSAHLDPETNHFVAQKMIEDGIITIDLDENVLIVFALDWFEQEREHLLVAISWAEEAERWILIVSFVSRLIGFFDMRYYPQDWERTCLIAITSSRKAMDFYGEGISTNNLANLYSRQSRWDDAINCNHRSVIIHRELKDKYEEGAALNNLGSMYLKKFQLDNAFDCFQKSLAIFQELGNQQGESTVLNSLASLYHSNFQIDEALDCCKKSLKIRQAIKDFVGEASSLTILGVIYESKEQWSNAFDCHKKSLAIYQFLGDRSSESLSLYNLGNIHQSQNKLCEAIDFCQQSLNICRELNYIAGESRVLNLMGIIYNSQSLLDEAIDCYVNSLNIYVDISDKHGESQVLNNLGSLYQAKGHSSKAVECINKSLSIANSLGYHYGESSCLNNLGIIYDIQGNFEDAISCHERSLVIKKKLKDKQGEGKTLYYLGSIYSKKEQQQKSIAFLKESLTKLDKSAIEYTKAQEKLKSIVRKQEPRKNRPSIIPLVIWGAGMMLLLYLVKVKL
jgi:tetratricopeptide (TPR) repeat protein